MSVVDLQSATKVKDIQVGAHLSHPEAIALDPSGRRAYVAVANSDQVAVIDTTRMAVERTISVERPEGLGASPVALTVTPDGRGLVVAEAGADELALVSLSAARPIVRSATSRSRLAWHAAGRPGRWWAGSRRPSTRPTSRSPPGATEARVGGRQGFRLGPNPRGPDPHDQRRQPAAASRHGRATTATPACSGSPPPGPRGATRLAGATSGRRTEPPPRARRCAPAGRSGTSSTSCGRTAPTTRCSATSRGDGDPALTLRPARHAEHPRAGERFPLLDHVYANSEASIDGHFWTSAAKVSDYVHKNWHQNYADRNRPYDFGIYGVTWPANGFLFDQAERQKISYFNYGEAVAGAVPLFPDKDRTLDL